jgi:hypothetical protein
MNSYTRSRNALHELAVKGRNEMVATLVLDLAASGSSKSFRPSQVTAEASIAFFS